MAGSGNEIGNALEDGRGAGHLKARRDRDRIGRLGEQVARLRKRLPLRHRFGRGLAHGVMSAVAAVIAYLPTQALGLREGFWSAITALAVAQTEFGATRSTARDQFLGAAVGGLIGLGIALAVGQRLVGYAAAVTLSILAAWLCNVASAGRLAAITATILLLVPHAGSVQRMLASRIFEVDWGICAAFTRINRRLGIDP